MAAYRASVAPCARAAGLRVLWQKWQSWNRAFLSRTISVRTGSFTADRANVSDWLRRRASAISGARSLIRDREPLVRVSVGRELPREQRDSGFHGLLPPQPGLLGTALDAKHEAASPPGPACSGSAGRPRIPAAWRSAAGTVPARPDRPASR